MDPASLMNDAYLPHVKEQSMAHVIAILQSVSEKQIPEPELLTSEYRDNLANQIASKLLCGEFSTAKDLIMRLNLIDMAINQSYADMDAGVKQKLDTALEIAHARGTAVDRKFLECAANRYQRIIDRMDLEGQTASPALIEYLNIHATVLELLGDADEAQLAHDRIPSVMVAMLEQQKAQSAKFCLSEKAYWDMQVSIIEEQACLSYEQLQTAKKALRFYEHKEAILCALTHDEIAIESRIEELRSLVLNTRAA